MALAGVDGQVVLVFDAVAGDVIPANLGDTCARARAVGIEAEGMDGVRPEPTDDGSDEHRRCLGFVPPVASDYLGDGAAYSGHFLVDEDGSELAVERGHRLAWALGGCDILLTIELFHRGTHDCGRVRVHVRRAWRLVKTGLTAHPISTFGLSAGGSPVGACCCRSAPGTRGAGTRGF